MNNMNPFYPHLFSPIRIGGKLFRNRIFCAPQNQCLQGSENHPTEAAIRYYADKARGGAATVCAGSCRADPQFFDKDAPAEPKWNQYNIYDEINLRYFAQQADAIHQFGAKASLELLSMPMGMKAGFSARDTEKRVVYALNDMVDPETGYHFQAYPEEEIHRMANAYAQAAYNAMTCGFDMILLHGGHGMNIAQFLSPKLNHRTDQYGGSLENRARFPILVVDKIRERCGQDLLIEFRISGSERTEGGFEIDECIDFLEMIQDKIDVAHISAGFTPDFKTHTIIHPSCFRGDAPNAYLARAVKQSGRIHIPVCAVGAIYDPAVAETLISDGSTDLVSTARQLIADPEMPNKARAGKTVHIMPCIQCCSCFDEHTKTHLFTCSVNPTIGRQHRLPYIVRPPVSQKSVLVVGGGPAGLEAAITAAKRGHKVTLAEKGDCLGGQLNYANDVDFKVRIKRLKDVLIQRAVDAGVTLRTGQDVTSDWIAQFAPEVLIVAVGAEPIVPSIEGADRDDVLCCADMFAKIDQVGKRVVVVGGGQSGCEAAIYLNRMGRDVQIITGRLAHDAQPMYRLALEEELQKGIIIHQASRCRKITDAGVVYSKEDGTEAVIQADTVVLATGMKARTELADRLAGTVEQSYQIGDCVSARNIKFAIRSGFDCANQI